MIHPRRRLRTFCLFAAIPLATLLGAQEPVTLEGDVLEGVIDFHVHSGPDSFTRSLTDLEIARLARSRKMARWTR